MRVPGDLFRTETITVSTVTTITEGRNAGKKERVVLHNGIAATVQPVSNAVVLQHGLTTDRPVYYARYYETAPNVGDAVTWNGDTYEVVSVSTGADIDTQLMMQLTNSIPLKDPPP